MKKHILIHKFGYRLQAEHKSRGYNLSPLIRTVTNLTEPRLIPGCYRHYRIPRSIFTSIFPELPCLVVDDTI
jgi:hypothetical protein